MARITIQVIGLAGIKLEPEVVKNLVFSMTHLNQCDGAQCE